jgi:hypothetical protein
MMVGTGVHYEIERAILNNQSLLNSGDARLISVYGTGHRAWASAGPALPALHEAVAAVPSQGNALHSAWLLGSRFSVSA